MVLKRITLRTLFVLITLLGGAFGVVFPSANRQKATIAWLEKNDSSYMYMYEHENGIGSRNGDPHKQLKEWIGMDYCEPIGYVSLSEGRRIEDFTPLANLTKLKHLHLGRHKTDISALRGLRKLEWLSLSHSDFTDLTPIEGMRELRILTICRTDVIDIRPLANLKKLTHLDLNRTDLTDVSPLADLTNLQFLWLRFSEVSDVSPLHNLSKLETLDIREAWVTEADYLELKAALPNCEIKWNDDRFHETLDEALESATNH